MLNVPGGAQSWGLDAGGVAMGQGDRKDFVKPERAEASWAAGVKASGTDLNHWFKLG